jgi:hypothetical protein
MREHVLQLDSIHDRKYPVQERLGNLEADKVVILLRGVAVLRDLNGVETELYRTDLPNLARSLGYSIATPDSRPDEPQYPTCNATVRPTREGVLVYILALEYQLANKVAAADVMHQVAEFSASKWVVAEVLNDRASVSIGVRYFDLVVRETGKRLSRRVRISSPHNRSTISSCVRTEYADKPPLHRSTTIKGADARRVNRRRRFAVATLDKFSHIIQILPRSSRIATMRRISPTPPLGAYPQLRL